ncbi:MAG: hypothetical protein JW715_03360 [Sedimentisphaerales bacterium]|nr:hypothetical protein [Sedimentisphaerales bacterium]
MNKNTVYIIIIVVGFLTFGVVAYSYIFSSGGGGISDSKMTWVKCSNPSCNSAHEMKLKEYEKQVRERMRPPAITTPALTCNECGKDTVLQAVKCENPECGEVFIKGSVRGDLEDRCPKCKHSATEDSRKARLAGRE